MGLVQFNTTVGDIRGNVRLIRDALAEGRARGCRIVAFPELAVAGYPPEDLLLRRSFCSEVRAATMSLAPETSGLVAVVGFVDWDGNHAYNAAAVFVDGRLCDTYRKWRLPNYGVFDEERYFAAGERAPVYHFRDARITVSICEDIWRPGPPLDLAAAAGAELCVNINASPYTIGKVADRARMLSTRASDNVVAVAYLNAVGGQDELVFDGASVVFDASGHVTARAPQFASSLLTADIDLDRVGQQRLHDPRHRGDRRRLAPDPRIVPIDIAFDVTTATPPVPSEVAAPLELEEEVWSALVLGTRDYLRKTGFRQCVIGLSGGIDSSLVAAIAVDAVGSENVVGVSMPSRFSSEHSILDARALADHLGIRLISVAIEPAHAAMLEMLADAPTGSGHPVALENLQARQRGNVLMTLSNSNGWIVLTTGNKSEMATCYATLYGDMAGGFAVIKDVSKTMVYRLARWRNSRGGKPVIPVGVIEKAPSAELRPDQRDQDTLPDYEVLDGILEAYVEDESTCQEIVAQGFDADTVARVVAMVDRSEYKRRQAPPGVKISARAFGRDRRLPIATTST